jgi:hypothetical protein
MDSVKFSGLVIAFSALAVACRSEEGSKATSQAGGVTEPKRFLKPADLKQPEIKIETSESDLPVYVSQHSGFRREDTGATEESDSESWMLQKECWKVVEAKVRANASSYSMEIDEDLTSCLNNESFGQSLMRYHELGVGAAYVPNSLELGSMRLRLAGHGSCIPKGAATFAGLDGLHAVLDGGDFQKIKSEVVCSGPRSEWLQTMLEGAYSFQFTLEGETRTARWSVKKLTAMYGKTLNESCKTTWNGDQGTMAECNHVESSVVKFNTPRASDRNADPFTFVWHSAIRFLDQPTEQNSKGPWYPSGTQKLTFNEWSGTITYTGSNTAPTINMSNGTSTVATRLPYGAGANLVGQDGASRSSFLMKALSRAMGKAPSRD